MSSWGETRRRWNHWGSCWSWWRPGSCIGRFLHWWRGDPVSDGVGECLWLSVPPNGEGPLYMCPDLCGIQGLSAWPLPWPFGSLISSILSPTLWPPSMRAPVFLYCGVECYTSHRDLDDRSISGREGLACSPPETRRSWLGLLYSLSLFVCHMLMRIPLDQPPNMRFLKPLICKGGFIKS